ncbi:MAG TPA: 5'-nucleotidase C-terminal domain-containing protein, partial [Deltaproteobacteria bacterium]|nr:5'-nucleotidase C-terminal domain-containing protein [Deltaproteobacteria bacterium]
RDEQLTPLGYLICKAIQTQTGVQVALVNNGAIRRGLKAGIVTYGHIMGVFPFDDYVVTMRMSGKDLTSLIKAAVEGKDMRACQFAGVRLRVRPGTGGRQRIVAVQLENGDAIRDETDYTVAVPDYIFEGGDGHNFAAARDAHYVYVQLRDMLVEYLEARRDIDAPDIARLYGNGPGRGRP